MNQKPNQTELTESHMADTALSSLQPRELLKRVVGIAGFKLNKGAYYQWLRTQEDPEQLDELIGEINRWDDRRHGPEELGFHETGQAHDLLYEIATHGRAWSETVAQKLLDFRPQVSVGKALAQNGHVTDRLCQQLANLDIERLENRGKEALDGGLFLEKMLKAGRPLSPKQHKRLRGLMEGELQPHVRSLLLEDVGAGKETFQKILDVSGEAPFGPDMFKIALHPNAGANEQTRAIRKLLNGQAGARRGSDAWRAGRAIRKIICYIGDQLPEKARKLIVREGERWEIHKLLEQVPRQEGKTILAAWIRHQPAEACKWLAEDSHQEWRQVLDRQALGPLLTHENIKIRRLGMRWSHHNKPPEPKEEDVQPNTQLDEGGAKPTL